MADIIPREFIDLLLAKIDIVELINAQIPLKKKTGSNFFACCPFHNEKSASFSVSQAKQFYYCFGCGEHGNAIDFVMKFDRLNFPESIEALARQTGMEIPKEAGIKKKDDSLPALFDLMEQAGSYFYEQMRQSQRAIDYLKGRSISGKIAQQFQLGYAPPGWSHLLDQLGKTPVDVKKLNDAGLIIKKTEGGYYDRFRDRIMFPIHDYRGRIIGFGGRVLDQGEPKYLNSPETALFQKGQELYGLHQTLKTHRKVERIIIVEGYMDVIALFQQGLTYAVATLGTATTRHHIQRLARYTNNLVFCFDGDDAGRKAAWRALEVALPAMTDQLQIRFLFLPDGEDPDSMVRTEGQQAFEQRLYQAHSLSAFFFETLIKECDLGTMEGRARLASMALTHIKTVSPGLFQSILLEELGRRSRIDVNELKQQLGQSGQPETTQQANTEPLIKTKLSSAMRMTLALIIQHPYLAAKLEKPEHTSKMPGHRLLVQLIDLAKKDSSISTGALIEHWRDQKEQAFIAQLANLEHLVPEEGLEKALSTSIQQLSLISFDEEINRLMAKAAQSELSAEEKAELTGWIRKKKTPVSILET